MTALGFGLQAADPGFPPGMTSKPSLKTPITIKKSRAASLQEASTAALLPQLPLWGTLTALTASRGFGHLSCPAQARKVFFHFNAIEPRKPVDDDNLRLGEPILFITGTDPREPGSPRAVRWARVCELQWDDSGPPHDQASLDARRKAALAKLPLETLWRLLRADWYTHQWNGAAPDDLTDPVLSSIWLDRTASTNLRDLAALTSPKPKWLQSANPKQRQHLMKWHLLCSQGVVDINWEVWFSGRDQDEVAVANFFIDQGLAHSRTTQHWIRRLIDKGWLSQQKVDEWVGDDPAEAAPIFRHLSAELQGRCYATWKSDPSSLDAILDNDLSISANQLLLNGVLALDLETDGHSIWEVGCARNGQAELLYGKHQGTALAAAMEQLGEGIRSAPLVAGHNLLAWDWPMVSKHINIPQPPLLWDTLLVQYLLEPQAQSHALGGNHHADTDALAVARLFEQQFKRLPAGSARSVLSGEFKDAAELLEEIFESIGARIFFAQPTPDWLKQHDATDAVIVLPDHLLEELNWVSDITVVSANPAEGLPQRWLQLDADLLAAGLTGQTAEKPAAFALLAVARRATAQGIALRFGMIPPWLLENSPALDLAVRQACHAPSKSQGLRVAPLPRDAQWLHTADPAAVKLLGFTQDVLVYGHRHRAPHAWTEMATGQAKPPLLRIQPSAGREVWLQSDGPARILGKGARWRSFRTLLIPKGLSASASVPATGSLQRPILATRSTHVLHPGTEEQAAYWTEVLRTFREAARHAPNAVPILLLGSSCSRRLVEILCTGLAEMGWGEVRPAYRSRQAHLLRAAHNQWALIDLMENWPQWQAIAQFAGVDFQPVVEALPIEQWFAIRHTQPIDASDVMEEDTEETASIQPLESDSDDSEDDDNEWEVDTETEVAEALPSLVAAATTPTTVWALESGTLLKEMSSLIRQFLLAWLRESGLVQARHPAILMDSRAAGLGKELVGTAALLPLQAHQAPLSATEKQRLHQVFVDLQVERDTAPSDFATMERFLVANWQRKDRPIAGFKASQKLAMEVICSRSSDVLVALPTGEGKSVLFQVPALCRGLRTRRLTLVLSPLKALMRDQVEGLHGLGFGESADYLSSDRPAHEIAAVLQGVLDHRIVLLYVAPERLRSALFVDVLRQRLESDGVLEYAVVDETHCVNQWGHEFRPDYFHALELLLREFRSNGEGEHTPFVLLSATVTASDRQRLQGILATAAAPDQFGLPLVVQPDAFQQPLRQHITVAPKPVHGRINDREAFEQVLQERLPVITQAIDDAKENQRKTGQRSAVIIFVTQREQAEKLTQTLVSHVDCAVDYFHAGLDAATREEVYEHFRAGEVNVLVATKAFGMGMDIPDIHWAIHLAPPAFLEDYLQEVGRIGRDADQIERAQLEKLKAVLLFSSEDFESIRDQRARSALQPSFIKDQHQKIVAHCRAVDGQWLAVVPHESFEPPQKPSARRSMATKLRMALYWLERADCIKLHGSIPNLLSVTLHRLPLARIAKEENDVGKVARVILSLEATQSSSAQQMSTEGAPKDTGTGNWLSRALGLIDDMAGILFGTPQPPQSAAATPAAATPGDALINLSQIMLRCGIKTLGDVMSSLVDLENRGGLAMQRNFEFAPRPLAFEPDEHIDALFNEIRRSHQKLAQRLQQAKGKLRFAPSDLAQDYAAPTVEGKKANRYQKAFEWGLISLARSSGISVRQVVDAGEVGRWEARLATSALYQTDQRCEKTLLITREIFTLLRQKAQTDNKVVSLKDLIETTRAASPQQRFRELDLQKALSLLSAMRLMSLSVTLLPMSYVLTLDSLNGGLDRRQDLWDELAQINRLAELRNDAMEIFANLPADAQSGFIEGYFSHTDGQSLEAFLEAQLGDIEDQGDGSLSSFISDKREHLRAIGVVEFFQSYQQSKEPNQWKAISHPYDQHLLVNAGPGSGKTSVLVGRVVHLIREQRILPSEIIVLAFNRAVVFEIKKRIRELFRKLGYASYAKRLRVATFHSFAMRSLAADDHGQSMLPERDKLLASFSQRLSSDARFREQVAGGCRSILVDEFQDVSDDIYQIIRHLHLGSGSSASVMVIGDDDQDIFRWQRPGGEFSERYFQQFSNDFGGVSLTSLLLKVNFRSGASIVERSQNMISGFFKKHQQSSRLKTEQLVPQHLQPVIPIDRIDSKGQTWQQVLDQVEQKFEQLVHKGSSLAILCRSNAEVAQAHRQLVEVLPHLAVQGNANFQVADLRHVGFWLEHLQLTAKQQNQVLTDGLKAALKASFVQAFSIPETLRPAQADVCVKELWDLCCAEQTHPHLGDLIRFIQDLQTDEMGRLRGVRQAKSQAVVSTIHKVKGLEFDSVIVLPSYTPFGKQNTNRAKLEMDAAEEARLLYVGMTRAKHRLTYFVGNRERAWGACPPSPFSGQDVNGQFLIGSHEDVSLRWAMGTIDGFNLNPDACQDYIEKEVRIGDPLTLGGNGGGAFKALFHRSVSGTLRQIGFLAKKHGAGGTNASLQVSAVVRFKPDPLPDGTLPTTLAKSVQERGWGYAVLVSGRLR